MAHVFRLLNRSARLRQNPYELHYPPSSLEPMQAKIKNGFPPKICERCGRPFEWRKKWARDWENVKYCSEKCKAGK
jgi:hypothetical protein